MLHEDVVTANSPGRTAPVRGDAGQLKETLSGGGFPGPGLLTLGPGPSLLWGLSRALWTFNRILVSTHWVPVAPTHTPQATERISRYCPVSAGGQKCPQ